MPKRGYHHGNLRQALVDAALTLVKSRGPTGFTLAEAAKGAGVTPAAVYRHFAGRDDLIAEAARQGYILFAYEMQSAYDSGQPSALKSLEATGRAYLAFARDRPGYYIAMFESGVPNDHTPDLAEVSGKARAVLTRAAEELSKHIKPEERPPPAMMAAHIWSLSHGVVELFARNAAGTPMPCPPEDLLASGIKVYLRGLGLLSDQR